MSAMAYGTAERNWPCGAASNHANSGIRHGGITVAHGAAEREHCPRKRNVGQYTRHGERKTERVREKERDESERDAGRESEKTYKER
jgi:hypothetical protein